MAADAGEDEGERAHQRHVDPGEAAARGLPPAAKSCLPKFVRCSKSQPTTPTTTRMITE